MISGEDLSLFRVTDSPDEVVEWMLAHYRTLQRAEAAEE